MLKRILSALFAVVLLSVTLIGCAGKPSGTTGGEGETRTVTDATGASVAIPQSPKNVAVLFSSFADIWKSAGGSIAITVGETVERGFAGADVILVDQGAGKTIDNERLFASNPDLVICSADIAAQSDTAALCRAAGIPALALRVESFEDYLRVLELFTDLTGYKEYYEAYGTAVAEQIQAILGNRQAGADGADAPKILFIRASTSAKSTKAKRAQDHFAAQMLAELGTVNIADSAPILLDGLSFEEILRQNPDVIFISTMGDENAAKSYMNSLLTEPTWQSLTAVQNGKVCYLPKDLFQFKPNARWAEAYAYLAELLSTREA